MEETDGRDGSRVVMSYSHKPRPPACPTKPSTVTSQKKTKKLQPFAPPTPKPLINLTSLQCDDDDILGVWFPPCGEGNEEDGVSSFLTSTKAGELVKEEKTIEEENTHRHSSRTSDAEKEGGVLFYLSFCVYFNAGFAAQGLVFKRFLQLNQRSSKKQKPKSLNHPVFIHIFMNLPYSLLISPFFHHHSMLCCVVLS